MLIRSWYDLFQLHEAGCCCGCWSWIPRCSFHFHSFRTCVCFRGPIFGCLSGVDWAWIMSLRDGFDFVVMFGGGPRVGNFPHEYPRRRRVLWIYTRRLLATGARDSNRLGCLHTPYLPTSIQTQGVSRCSVRMWLSDCVDALEVLEPRVLGRLRNAEITLPRFEFSK